MPTHFTNVWLDVFFRQHFILSRLQPAPVKLEAIEASNGETAAPARSRIWSDKESDVVDRRQSVSHDNRRGSYSEYRNRKISTESKMSGSSRLLDANHNDETKSIKSADIPTKEGKYKILSQT